MSRDRSGRGGKRVTLKQVAESLGVSPTTVSLVLNRSPAADSIPRATHERVFAAARELGYKPNIVARSLRSRRSYSLGVLVPEISEGYTAGILSGVEERLLADDYFYLVASHRSQPDRLEKSMKVLQERLVEGFILVNTPLLEAPGLPAVAVAGHRRLDDVTNVVIDHDRAALLALNHLAELGHRRIAFFKGHAHSADTDDRWAGIERAAEAIGIDIRPELVLQLGGDAIEERFTPEEGYEEGAAFGAELLRRNHELTALFAFNDISAIGAMRTFLEAGLRVPEDLSVVGFDDIHGAAFHNPGLTTVRQPLREMGETACELLLRRLRSDHPEDAEVTIEPSLVVRASTGKAAVSQGVRRGGRSG